MIRVSESGPEYERMQVGGDRLYDGDVDFFGASAIYAFSLGGAR